MSVHVIYYKDGAKMMRPILSRESYMKLRGGEKQKAIVRAIRMGDVSQKHLLQQMNYSCLPNEDGTLKGSTRVSGSVGMDIDHIAADEMEAVKERILARKDELGLLMLERSARGQGYHVVFRRREGLTQEENLKWASELLGVEFDKGAKDITRVFFATTDDEEDLLYFDDGIFENGEFGELNECGREPVDCGRITRKGDGADSLPSAEEGAKPDENHQEKPSKSSFPSEYKGIAYKDIIAKYWELFNDGKEPTTGDRDTLTYQLACDLRHICGRDAEWLDQVIPCYDGFTEGEKRQKIMNALSAKSEGMPYRLKQVLSALKAATAIKACGGTMTVPPALPKKLPPLVKLLTSKVPDAYKAAVAAAVFPALGAHLHGVKFRYWDNVDHEATFMNVLIGRQSTGKSCIKKPIEYIMEDIRQRDIPNRQREAEWKQKNPGAKQKKDPRPTDICIQMLIDNLTDAVFNQRIVDAHNNGQRFLYTIVDEIEALKKVTSKGSTDEVGLLIRKAFDNSMAGQERVGADSVSGIAPLRWNFNASTTPPNARKFLWKMVNDGTLSRLDLSTIIIAEGEEDETPVLGIYDNQFAQELKPYLDRLDAASGLIECPQAKKLALDIRQENRDTAQLYDSEAYRMLYFGQQLEEELREEIKMQSQSGPQNLLELLPDEFGREEYRLMREKRGKSGDGAEALRKWVTRGYIFRDEVTGKFRKTEEYLRKVKVLS